MGQPLGCGFGSPFAYLHDNVYEAPDIYIAVASAYGTSYVVLSHFWWDPLYGKRTICPQVSSRKAYSLTHTV